MTGIRARGLISHTMETEMKNRTYKTVISREGRDPTTIVDNRLSVIAELVKLSVDEILWAIEEEGKCETEWADGVDVTITEIE